MKIKPVDRDTKNLFEAGFYKIPRFQRPYSWDKANIEDFWKDVTDVQDEYFIGSMVAYRRNDNKDLYYLVDGQQRLTTITIFLAVLRNALLKHGDEKLAHAIQTLIARKDINGEDTYVLQTETSYPFFQEHIQKLGKPDLPGEPGQEEEALRLAFEYLTNNVEGIAKAIHDDPSIADDKKKEVMTQRLTRIRDTLLRLKVIFIELDDEDDAYLIFETLSMVCLLTLSRRRFRRIHCWPQ